MLFFQMNLKKNYIYFEKIGKQKLKRVRMALNVGLDRKILQNPSEMGQETRRKTLIFR